MTTEPIVLPAFEANADPESLVSTLDYVLAMIIARFEQANITLPDRRYWTLGTPAADCEQLTVSFALLYTGAPGDQATEPSRCSSPRSATLSVQILRCVPTTGSRGVAPTATAIQAASVAQAIDAWMLLDTACLCDSWGLGVIATVTAGEAQGGFQGVEMTLTLAVP